MQSLLQGIKKLLAKFFSWFLSIFLPPTKYLSRVKFLYNKEKTRRYWFIEINYKVAFKFELVRTDKNAP
jgi:hypothetical protein